MAKVDPYDDSVFRYVIMRHQFDPKTNHFRWFYESAYDSKWEYGKRLQEAFELAIEVLAEVFHRKIQTF